MSRSHARLLPSYEGWTVESLTSSNAVFVEGEPADGVVVLPQGGTLQLGGVVCILVSDPGTSPVLQRLDEAWIFEVRDDGGQCSVHVGDTMLPLSPAAAKALSMLVENVGRPVHRWDLLEVLGANTNLDKTMSLLRRGIREALEGGVLDREAYAEALRVTGEEPAHSDPSALVKASIVTRRGHGYVLCLAANRVRRVAL